MEKPRSLLESSDILPSSKRSTSRRCERTSADSSENLETCVPNTTGALTKFGTKSTSSSLLGNGERLTLLNSLGRGLVQTVSTFRACRRKRSAASINLNDHSVAVYDNEPGGNGTSASVKQHYRSPGRLWPRHGRCLRPCSNGRLCLSLGVAGMLQGAPLAPRGVDQHQQPGIQLNRALRKYEREGKHLTARFSDIWTHLERHDAAAGRASEIHHALPRWETQGFEVDIPSVDLVDQSLRWRHGLLRLQRELCRFEFPGLLSDRYTSRNVVERYFGLAHDKPGYASPGEARRKEGVMLGEHRRNSRTGRALKNRSSPSHKPVFPNPWPFMPHVPLAKGYLSQRC